MKLLCIVGPTATGKTAVAIELARRLDGEVISCDSMQIYRGMDIGTAKATAAERAAAPHHMLDLVAPHEPYSAARYAQQAAQVIEDIVARGKRPILTGGTGLYLRALLYGLHDAAPDDGGQARARWQDFAAQNGLEALHGELARVDSITAERLSPGDIKRVVRALEVYTLTGLPLSMHHERSKQTPPCYDAQMVGLTVNDRQVLYERIDRRVEQMRRQGLTDEVRALLAQGLSGDTTAMQAIGYKELVQALSAPDGDLDAAYAAIAQATRRYAKRQLTWFRALPEVCWFDVSRKNVEGLSTEIMEKYGLP